MKNCLLILLSISLVFILGCDGNSDKETETGQIIIRAFDAPFQGNVEHIFLNIVEVSVHKSDSESESDTSSDWIVLSDTDTTIDFLELVNGEMAMLVQTELEAGHYSQQRLLLGDSSAIVVDGNTYDLKVPSGSQSGVKFNLGFSIAPDEIVEFYLDFDAERSIYKYANDSRYILQPTFRVFKSQSSGTIAGTVTDTSGTGLQNISVYAVAGDDSITTLTGESGAYMLILLAGIYDVSALGYDLYADTTYQAVQLNAEEHLTNFDFIMK